jgi:hypothetical protein
MYTQRNLTDGGLTAPLPVLSPSNILPSLSSNALSFLKQKMWGAFK